jgi:predicted nuclease with TOPRIM domain
MTVSELAKKLNTTVHEILEHYRRILMDIPQDENYVLTAEQIKTAIPNYKAEEKLNKIKLPTELKPKFVTTRLEDLKSKLEERRTKRIEIPDNLEPYFRKGDSALLKPKLSDSIIRCGL